MNPTLKCHSCGRALCGLIYIDEKPFCADCIGKCLSSRDAEIAETKKTIEQLKVEVASWQTAYSNLQSEISVIRTGRTAMLAEKAKRIAYLKSQRDAMQRRAETAESDWQNAETEIAEKDKRIEELMNLLGEHEVHQEEQLTLIRERGEQIADLKAKLEQAEARLVQYRGAASPAIEVLDNCGCEVEAGRLQNAINFDNAALSGPPAGEKKYRDVAIIVEAQLRQLVQAVKYLHRSADDSSYVSEQEQDTQEVIDMLRAALSGPPAGEKKK